MIKKYLAIKASKSRCIIVMAIMLCLYFLDNSSIVSFINNGVFVYIIKPILWSGLALVVWKFPRIHPSGKLRLRGLINIWALNFAILFIVISVFIGFIDGFGKSGLNNSFSGVLVNFIIIISALIGKELARSYLVNSITKEENYFIFVLIAVFMTLIQFSLSKYTNSKGYISTIQFIAKDVGPEFAKNLLAVYLVYIGGAIPSIIFMGTLQVFYGISPILPNLKWVTTALIGILCPILCLIVMQSIYGKEARIFKRKYKENAMSWIAVSILSIMIVWFAAGVFPIYPAVIATGSMKPLINPGDIILIERVNPKDLKVGDIIYFKHNNIFISHRIINTLEEKKIKVYQTKGDNNSAPDSDYVKLEFIKGKVVKIIPKIGWPTLLLKLKRETPLEKVEF
jgi:signal peptidase